MIHQYVDMIKISVSMIYQYIQINVGCQWFWYICPASIFVGCQGFLLSFCDLLFVCRTDPSSDDEYELFQLFERYYQICQEMSFPLPQGTCQLTAPFF